MVRLPTLMGPGRTRSTSGQAADIGEVKNADHDQVAGHPRAKRVAMTPSAGAARQPREASGGHRMAVVMVGAAVAARLVRNARTHEAAVLIALAVVAAAGLGNAGRTRVFARLAAWDKRVNARVKGWEAERR